MLNRKLVDYTDISSKYVKVGVRYCVFCCFCCVFFDFHVTSSLFLLLSVLMYAFDWFVTGPLDPPFHFRGGVSTLESLVLSPELTFPLSLIPQTCDSSRLHTHQDFIRKDFTPLTLIKHYDSSISKYS